MMEISDQERTSLRNQYGRVLDTRQGYKNEDAIRACAVADHFSREINLIGFDEKACAEAMYLDHRTLLQTKTRIFVEFLRLMANDFDNGNYDARNEGACKTAKTMIEALEQNSPAMPFI